MEHICNGMSRKTRTRQTRIHAALQSGYCAICHIPYNSLDDHIQSKKHLKLIGEDANYISINGFIDQNSLMPFLNLNGIDSIDVNGKQIEKDFCPRLTRNAKNKGICEMLETSTATTTPSTPPVHHLRSRKQINYAISPSLDEDSLSCSERQETVFKTPVKERKNNNNSCRTTPVTKPLFLEDDPNVELWNSGRPKRRSCIKSKRTSADERLVVDNKIYYKVEVLSSKLRSSSQPIEIKQPEIHNHTNQEVRDEKGAIKSKKTRYSELTLLNNEAENFLFPKKDESSSEDEAECQNNDSISDAEDFKPKHEVEDDASMDSTTSSGKRRKRRTHAEAFIMDNQKYYKFETPGSRLRYHGSFFPDGNAPTPGLKSPKSNGDVVVEKTVKEECNDKFLDLEHYRFSFETVPSGEKWYEPFWRQDRGEESYIYLPYDGSENRLVLPYQMGVAIPALDPKICIAQYAQLKKFIQEQSSSPCGSRTSCSTPESTAGNYTPSQMSDEDSKSSEICNPSSEFCEDSTNNSGEAKKKTTRGKAQIGSKNPRKSPRQHASTLAILSSLLHQRKSRKLKGGNGESTNETLKYVNLLPTIPEQECSAVSENKLLMDYEEILTNMDGHSTDFMEELGDSVSDFKKEEAVEFSNKLDILDVLRIHDEIKMRDDHRSNRRFINGSPGRKPGRRKKLNKTGWPNRKKGGLVRLVRGNANVDATDNLKNKLEIIENCDSNRVKVGRKLKSKKQNVKNSARRTTTTQSDEKVKKVKKSVVKRTNKRKMPASPKSPRMLRKPRGKWYKER